MSDVVLSGITITAIPPLGDSVGVAALSMLPKQLPQTMTTGTLEDLYDFGEVDDIPHWMDGKHSYEQVVLGTAFEEPPGPVDICGDTVSGESVIEKTNYLNSWYKVVVDQQDRKPNRADDHPWIIETALPKPTENSSVRMMRAGVWSLSRSANSGLYTHPQATPTKPVPPPMPTPSFAPASSGGSSAKVKVGDSLEKVLQFKKGKLEAVAPTVDCAKYDTDEFESKVVLTYDPETGKMVWDCTEPAEGVGEGGCCPALMYGDKLVVAVTDQGMLITREVGNPTIANPFYHNDYVVVSEESSITPNLQ